MYDSFGRAAVRFAFGYLRRRYRREIRIGFGVGAAVIADRRLPGQPQRPRGLIDAFRARNIGCGLSSTREEALTPSLASGVPWGRFGPKKISSQFAAPWRCSSR